MTPKDFHKTAAYLKDQPDEWHVRTTVNRSYYGVFLYFRDFFANHGVYIPIPLPQHKKRKSQHQFIIECFEQSTIAAKRRKKAGVPCDPSKVWQISSKLKTLFANRINADYNLSVKFIPSYSTDSFKNAMKTLEEFDSLAGSDMESLIVNTAISHGERIKIELYERR